MMNSLRLASLLLFASASAGAVPAAQTTGDWQTPIGSVIRVQPCGAFVCLAVVKLPPNAPSTTDGQNPDASLRKRPLCGLMIGTGFHQDDAEHLSGGHLYDPKSGHTYRGTISAEGDSLHLRGYIGISLFGRSETWKRVPAITACHS
jgi:uncharacterized protein (DUF2147 family)